MMVRRSSTNRRTPTWPSRKPPSSSPTRPYCAAPANNRYELLDGESIMVPAPNIKHESVRFLLGHHLGNFTIGTWARQALLWCPAT